MDRYYKRFIRDYVHYIDIIFCKAAMIINKLLIDSKDNSYSSFHIRRGEFQYKEGIILQYICIFTIYYNKYCNI